MLLYLHIPFCDSKCHYCAFNSYVDKFDLKKDYMNAVVKQLKNDLSKYDITTDSIESVFIGGGTPSTVEPILYEKFFQTVSPYLKKDIEITTEANPNSSTKEWLEGMKNLGVNRISFGVQSFDEDKLKFLGRNHSKKSALNSIENAYDSGFENISLDLIYQTIKDTEELLINDIKIASSLPINHISAYSLTLEKGTLFYKKPEVATNSDSLSKFFIDSITSYGFPQYEISNFGAYESIHNLGYWQHKNYLGIGAGAVGFFQNRRFYPLKNIEKYVENPDLQDIEEISKKDLHIETIFLGLRSKIGVMLEEFTKEEKKKVDILLKEKKLTCKGNRVYNTNYLLSDEIVLFII